MKNTNKQNKRLQHQLHKAAGKKIEAIFSFQNGKENSMVSGNDFFMRTTIQEIEQQKELSFDSIRLFPKLNMALLSGSPLLIEAMIAAEQVRYASSVDIGFFGL